MLLFRLIIALLPLALFACAAAPGRTAGIGANGTDPAARAIAELLTPPLASCPDRVWPGLPGREFQVLLVEPETRRALLWNDLRKGFRGGPRISPVPFEEVPPLFTSGSEFQFGELYGNPTLGFSYDAKADPSWSAEVVVHEAFHRYVQGGWKGAGGKMDRGIRYPEPWRPRYLRREAIRSLRAAADGNAGGVADAAGWMSRLRDGFPDAYRETRKVDVIEGTASFAGVMAASVAAAGCGADERSVIAGASRRVRGRWSAPDKEEESYALGVLAGLALRARGTTGWERIASGGIPPAEILLSSEAPGNPVMDGDFARATEAGYASANRAIGEKLAPILTRRTGDREYLVAVPSGWMRGSFATSGFVTVPEEGRERTFTLEMSADFVSPRTGSRLSLEGVTTETGGAPCGEGLHYRFPVPADALEIRGDGTTTLRWDGVRGDAVSFEPVRDGGSGWLCIR